MLLSSKDLLYQQFFLFNDLISYPDPLIEYSNVIDDNPMISCQSSSCLFHNNSSFSQKKKNLIRCSSLNCMNYSHFSCSRLNGFLITSSPDSENLKFQVKYECQLHHTVPRFCICQASLVDNFENIIRCNRCYEWYHPNCLNVHASDEFICNFCNELPDLANIKDINLRKKEHADALQRGNLIILTLHEFEVSVCPIIDKISLLDSYLSDFPAIQDAICNDATLAHRVYSSSQYHDALKISRQFNDSEFYGLASLLSQWEQLLLKYKNHSIPDTILMEWCCSPNLILQDLSLRLSEDSLQNPSLPMMIESMFPYLDSWMLEYVPLETLDRINSRSIEDKSSTPSTNSDNFTSDALSKTYQWVDHVFKLFSSSKTLINCDEIDIVSLPSVTPQSMEMMIKHGRIILKFYEDIVSSDESDTLTWMNDLNHLLAKLLDILESKWVKINSLYSKVNKAYPFLLAKKGKFQGKIEESTLQQLIQECEDLLIRSEILDSLRRTEKQCESLKHEIDENLQDLSVHHIPILTELESKIRLFPVSFDRESHILTSLEFLKKLAEFPDFNSQSTLCQIRLSNENVEGFLKEYHSRQQRENHSKGKRRTSRDQTSSPPPENKIHHDSVLSLLEFKYSNEFYGEDCQIYYQNIQYLSNRIKNLIHNEDLQAILHSHETSIDGILLLLQNNQQKIHNFYEKLQLEYYECIEEYELKFLLGCIDILGHYLMRQKNQIQSSDTTTTSTTSMIMEIPIINFDNNLSIIQLNQEINLIYEIINYSESSSYILLQTIGRLFNNEVLPNTKSAISAYETLNDYLNLILYTDDFPLPLSDLKLLFYSVYYIYQIKDPEPTTLEENKKKYSKGNQQQQQQTPRTLYQSLKSIIDLTENLEKYLKSLPSLDINALHTHVKATKDDFLTIFPSTEFDDFENILTILNRLPLSQELKDTLTRSYKLDSIESLTARHSESIKLFTSKIVDTSGKWLLKTPLKDTERREIMSLFELMKFEVDAVRQAIQEASKGMMNSLIDSPKLESAISSHIQLKWWLYCSRSLIGIVEPISIESATELLAEWNTSLSINLSDIEREYNYSLQSINFLPSSEIMQQKAFLEKWIQMTNERVAGFEDLSQQYQTLVHDYERRYQEKLTSISNELIESYDLSSVDDYSRYNPQLRILFDLIIELKQSLQPLQDQLKTDKRFLFTPVFRLSNDISNQINTFLSIYHVLSLLPNSIVLVFSDGNEYQSSYSCILSYDKLQKIIKVFNNNSTIYNSWIILFHMKVFLESLYTKSMQWSQDSKKLMPIGTRAGIKKAAIQYKFSDLIKVLEDPVTRYIEPPGYHELVEVSNSFQECEKDLISLLIPEGRDDDEDYEDTQIVSYLDLCRLVERWNNLRDRIHQLPIQFDKYSALFKWLTELFEWIRAVPEQVFDLLQIPDLNTNHFNVTNNSRKLNLIDKDKCNVLLDIGNNFLTQSNNQILTQLFNELHVLDNDYLNNTSTNSSPFYHFSEKVNSIIRFTPKIHQYFTKCFDETIQYESLAKGILDKISNFTTPENLDKSIDTLKKLIGRCDELLILPDGLLRINMKNLLRQLETSLWDGITLFNENNKKVEQESSIEVFTDSEQWIPSNLNNTQGTSEELLTSAISYFEDEDEEFIDESLLGDDDDDEFLPSPAKKRKRTKNKKYDVETSHHKSSGRKSSTSDFIDLEEEDESLQNCIIDGCEWPRMKNSSYCSESCAMKGYSHLFDALLNFKPLANHQIISQNHDDNNSKFEQVVQALDQGNTTPEALLHECKVFGMRTADIMLHSLSQVSIDFLFPQLPPIGAALSNTLRKQVRTELQHAILSALTRLKIPCAFGCAVVMATDIEKAMSLNVTSEDSVRAYRKKYLLLSKALKDPYNDAKIHKILFHEMSVEDFLKLDSTEFDDDEKQQRRLESINAEKKKLVPAGKSLTELIEEKRRAAEEGAEAWRDGTIMDQAAGVKSASSTLPSKSSAPISSTITPVPKKPPKEIHVEVKAKEPEIKVESKKHESPRSHPSPKPSPKQVAPPISSLLQMDSNKRPKVEKNEDMSHISVPASEQKGTTPIATSTPIEYFTDVRVSTPLGPASAHVPQMPNPEDGPLKVLLTNSNDSEFVIHITNYPIMRETISLVCTGGIFDCTGQGILVSGIQNDKRYQVDALRKQLRNFRKHIPISILVLSVKEERELTEVKYRHICKMFSDPEKERIPSVEFHGEHEQTYNLHIVVPQLAHYFPQLNSIIQRSTSVLPHGFWLYGILEMDRDAQGPESLVRCNQVDFPLENIKFLMGKVDKLVHTIESMPEPDVKLAIERVQQTVGDQLDFLNPGHKDFQFFINQVNQRLREKKLQEWSRDNEKKRKLDGKTERVREVTEKPKDDRQSIGSSRSSSFETRNPSPRGHESNHSHMSISRRASHEEQLPYKEPQLARSYSDEYSSQYRNGSNSIKEERNHDWKNPTSQRKSRFS